MKFIEKLCKKFNFKFSLVRTDELARLRSSEMTWNTAIKSLERHNELMRKANEAKK